MRCAVGRGGMLRRSQPEREKRSHAFPRPRGRPRARPDRLPRRRRPRASLAGKAAPADRAVPARRTDRSRRPRGGGHPARGSRPAGDRRQPSGRKRNGGGGRARQVGARRLHHRPHGDHARDGAAPRAGAVRLAQRFLADLQSRLDDAVDRRESRAPGQQLHRVRGLRAREPRQAVVRDARRGDGAAPRRRNAAVRGRDQAGARAVQGGCAADPGSASPARRWSTSRARSSSPCRR